ncbi:DUF6270 domain-containing protein [Butyrivibrio sp. INlla16]|uniref:DUF6270 domain-containing protein n=1 Tax=Butyrivibrio sp. INlla16 TaxID=1520807 RepID=UPI00087E5BAC|nr:DUF6270 domain-containing protein [Butyrivibrio sp. INlla16]SDB32200.1 hypothetical protein SAMN02910263_01547 [Butyrivibrio sp. INlla16]
MPTFDVLGCCVSRDIFNYLDQEVYSLDKKITLYINAHTCDRCLSSLDGYLPLFGKSDFMRRMAKLLIMGNLFEVLGNKNNGICNKINDCPGGQKWLVLDFANERFPLQLWQYKDQFGMMPVCWDTYKWGEEIKSRTAEFKIADWHFADRNARQYAENIERYIDSLLKIYDTHHIIYIQTRLCDEVRDDNENRMYSLTKNTDRYKGIDEPWRRKKGNQLIEAAEKILLEKTKDAYIIPFPEGVFINSNHIWGTHPLHYDELYYEYAATAIKLIAKDNATNTSDRKILIERELQFLKKQYENKFSRVRGLAVSNE